LRHRIKAEKLKVATKRTINRYLALVRSILLRACNDWEWIDRVPKVKLHTEGPVRERALTPAQAEALMRELPTHQRDVVEFSPLRVQLRTTRQTILAQGAGIKRYRCARNAH
jgi:integrase